MQGVETLGGILDKLSGVIAKVTYSSSMPRSYLGAIVMSGRRKECSASLQHMWRRLAEWRVIVGLSLLLLTLVMLKCGDVV